MNCITRRDTLSGPGRSGLCLCVVAAFTSCGVLVAQDKKNSEPAPLAGCEDQVKSGGPKGKEERFFPMPLDKVKAAATSAVNALEFEVKKDAKDTIEANKARHIGVFVGSGGEHIVLHFKEAAEGGKSGTMVSGETKKTMMGRLGQKTWTTAILAQTACFLQKEGSK